MSLSGLMILLAVFAVIGTAAVLLEQAFIRFDKRKSTEFQADLQTARTAGRSQ